MVNFARSLPQIPVVLTSLVFWFSFAWALPAETPAAEGDAEATPDDPWAGVKISDAYDYAQCPACPDTEDIRAETCPWCGYEFPQPSAEVTDPEMVFVPGLGYYREGTLLEPAKIRKGTLIMGLVLSGLGATGMVFIVKELTLPAGAASGDEGLLEIAALAASVVMVTGAILVVFGLKKSKPVYAFNSGGFYEPCGYPAYARTSPDSGGLALKVEVTALGF